MFLLSASTTALESMPEWLQCLMLISPSTRYVGVSRAVFHRGAGMAIVWPQMPAMAGIGCVVFATALLGLRKTIAASG